MVDIDELKDLIETVLDVPCYMEQDGCTFPCATVEIPSDDPELFGDGKAKNRERSAQIDLWYLGRTERDAAQAALLEALEELPNITAPDILAVHDNVAKKWRTTFHFTIY